MMIIAILTILSSTGTIIIMIIIIMQYYCCTGKNGKNGNSSNNNNNGKSKIIRMRILIIMIIVLATALQSPGCIGASVRLCPHKHYTHNDGDHRDEHKHVGYNNAVDDHDRHHNIDDANAVYTYTVNILTTRMLT